MSPDRGDESSVDALWETISNPTRRAVLDVLRDTERVRFERIVANVLEAGRYQSDGGERRAEASEVEIALHHHHLPKMASAGMISYDPETRTVTADATAEVATELVDRIESRDGP